MILKLNTPMGEVTVDIVGGAVGNAEITPEGGVILSFYPVDMTQDGETVETDTYIGERP